MDDVPVRSRKAACLVPWLAISGLATAVTANAQAIPPAAATLDTQEQRERNERDAAAREQTRSAPDVRLEKGTAADFHRVDLPSETPCFPMHAIRLRGEHSEAFAFVQKYLDRYAGRCIGHEGVNLIVRRAGELAIDRGYVTTRIGLEAQDLSRGELVLTLVPGVIDHIRYSDDTRAGDWRTALPMRPGELLNLRDIEQGLEQFKRVPSQDVNIDIAPGAAPGESDLLITVRRTRPWNLVASLDDSGSRATGRGQAGLNLGIDNPLGLNDLLALGYNRNVPVSGDKGTQGVSGNYSVPWGNWLFTGSFYGYRYHQMVSGSAQAFLSRGTSRTVDLNAKRLLHRDRNSKTTLEMRVGRRWAHSYIEDVELDTQRRNTTLAEVALSHRRYLGSAQLDLRLGQRRGVHWFGGMRDMAGQRNDEPTFGYHLTIFDASLNLPFQLGRQPLQWTSELHAQRSPDMLYGSEFIAIGGRYTVRGFDGEQTLAAERGWYWRNTMTVPVSRWPFAFYAGIDSGHVGGPSGRYLGQKSLSGGFAGLRGSVGRLNWDAFAGWSLRGGRQLDSMRPATGFSLIYQF